MRLVCRPLTSWPAERRTPTRSRFDSTWGATVALLTREARMLGAREVVLQLAVSESDIRLDGWIYAAARPKHPAVTIVLPDSDQGRMSFSTDRYDRWEDNVRAVALSMEALRVADRHGVMQGRQYAGFRELGSGIPMDAPKFTVESAARFIADHTGDPDPFRLASDIYGGQDGALERAYRAASKKLHPDVGGDPDLFRRLQEAKALLDRHGSGASRG